MDLKKAEISVGNSSRPPGRDHQVKTTVGLLRWATFHHSHCASVMRPQLLRPSSSKSSREIIDGLRLCLRPLSEHSAVAEGSNVPSVQFSGVQPLKSEQTTVLDACVRSGSHLKKIVRRKQCEPPKYPADALCPE
jgi:hypothetical protein